MRALLCLVFYCAFAIQTQISCESTSLFYDTSIMECTECGENKIASDDWLTCECASGTYKSEATRELPNFECITCTNGAPSVDAYECQSCPGELDPDTNDCECDYAKFEAVKEISSDGTLLDEKECVACASFNYFTGPGSHVCEACPYPDIMERDVDTYECLCITGYIQSAGSCVKSADITDIISQYPLENARTVVYNFVETNSGLSKVTLQASDTFSHFYIKSLRDCSNTQQIEACQNLANLCVLQLYNEETAICQVYKYIQNTRELASADVPDPGLKENMAWIYYENNAEDVLTADTVNMDVTFDSNHDSKVNLLEFQLAMFRLNGTFIQYESLTDQLLLCPHSDSDSSLYRKLGTNVIYDCDLDLTPYIYYDETIFYDPYLVDQDGTLIDVPVLIENFVDENGDKPNEDSDKANWRLTRRFFIYDNVSGKVGTNAYSNGNKTTILTYPKSIKLTVTLKHDTDEKIYQPLLTIKYRTRQATYIEQEESKTHLSFTSEYTMDTSTFWEAALGIFIVINIVLIVMWLGKVYLWTKNNPSIISRNGYTGQMILRAVWLYIGTWSFVMFWFLFVFTAYWFIFYKMQYHVYVLLPPLTTYQSNYLAFAVVFGLTVAFQILAVLDVILTQAKVDFMFIDWESPGRILRPGADQIKAIISEARGDPPRPEYYKNNVSAWRTLFVANEINEIQSARYINLEFTLIFALFFLSGLGWEQLGSAQPNLNTDDGRNTKSPMNPVLRFFVDSFILLVIGYTQLVIRKIMSTWIPTRIQNFVDLCAISNISIFILDESLHGYYIHGCNPNGVADVTLDELLKGLGKEEKGTAFKRGLQPDDPTQLQTFEIYIPLRVRETYNTMTSNSDADNTNSLAAAQKINQASKLWLNSTNPNEPLTKENIDDVRNQLNSRFKTYISEVIRDNKTQILEKSPIQRFLNMPPTDMSTFTGLPFFYRDIAMGFEHVFFMGQEFSLLLLDILIFDTIDLAAQNIFIAALVTFIFSKCVMWLRQKLGESNLSKKTLVDKRFLI